MFINNQFQILSEHTLWVIDENQCPQRCSIDYNNMEVIRVLFPDGSTRDYPIEDEVTMVPPLGLVFFKKEEDAARFADIIDTDEGLDIVTFNVEQSSRRSSYNESFSGTMKEGIYCIPYFDESLSDWTWLRDIRYIDSNMKIKEPIPVNETQKEKFVQYMTMHDVETNTDFNHERLLFEVVCEDGKTYINHFIIRESKESHYPIYVSRNYQFPVFCDYYKAWFYRDSIRHGGKPNDYIREEQRSLCVNINKHNEKESRHELIKKIAGILGDYAWSHANEILGFIKDKRKKKDKK